MARKLNLNERVSIHSRLFKPGELLAVVAVVMVFGCFNPLPII